MAELKTKKIFEEMILMKTKIDYDDEENKFIVKCDEGNYRYEFGDKMDGWIELMKEGCLEIEINVSYSSNKIFSRLSKEEIVKIDKGLKIVVHH